MKRQELISPGFVPDSQLAPPSMPPSIALSRDDTSGASKGQADALRIMIVEDDYLVASEIQGALRDAGFEVVGIATSADEAIQLAINQRPLLVVMDVRLSGERDGVDAAIDLFSLQGIRCVFATAHHTPETRMRAKPANPLAWLAKPYTMPSLIEMVQKAVQDVQ